MTAQPTSLLTFLFTDIGGSTRLWEQPKPMRAVRLDQGTSCWARPWVV